MNNYEVALDGFSQILKNTEAPMQSFDRRHYHASFERVYEQMLPAFDALEALYTSVKEPETLVDNMAKAVVDSAVAQLDACKKRSQKDIKMMNMNMQLAVFINPAILHYKGESSRPVTDQIALRWKEAFPKTNVQIADLETIEKGFHRRFCYITTAVCRTFGKADDCYELQTFRAYRDRYLARTPEGEEKISRYYDVAPSIVKHINQREDAARIYRGIWDSYLAPCLRMIEEGEDQACAQLYQQMVEDMHSAYFKV